MTKVAVIGTVGLPAKYGGFETLVENLVREAGHTRPDLDLSVYCSAKSYPDKPAECDGANLRYISLDANGAQSILYDALSLLDACRKGDEVIVILGVSGGIFIPLAKAFWNIRIVTNIDGLEWRRAKWGRFARWFLKFSERIAVRFSDDVITDNQAITDYVKQAYKRDSTTIAYGGDQALADAAGDIADLGLPDRYALALCRIEPENNVGMILDAYWGLETEQLVFVGNWEGSDYGRRLRTQYGDRPNIRLVDPVYDPARLRAIRDRADLYIHGHSAGGTNPSLVEMMQFGVPILAYDCTFNRHSTENKAIYFNTFDMLRTRIHSGDWGSGTDMAAIAKRKYQWADIAQQYISLFEPLKTGLRRAYSRIGSVIVLCLICLLSFGLSGLRGDLHHPQREHCRRRFPRHDHSDAL